MHKDPSAALKLGHARAIALLAAAQAGLEIAEYTPNHIKKCVVGAGHAGKEQVMAMVKRLLPRPRTSTRKTQRTRWPAPSRMRISSGTRARIAASLLVMIGKLTGIVDSVAEDHAILDVGGVGYLVALPVVDAGAAERGRECLADDRDQITDETIRLYGFFSAEEREWFRLLQTVQNVGARVALNVLSALSSRELRSARWRWATRPPSAARRAWDRSLRCASSPN